MGSFLSKGAAPTLNKRRFSCWSLCSSSCFTRFHAGLTTLTVVQRWLVECLMIWAWLQLYCIVPMGFLPWEIWVAFSGESQRRQSRTTQPTVHTGCFSVSISHHTLTWTTGSLTCAHMLMHAIAHRNVRTRVRESALKVDSWRKSHAAPGNQTCVSGVMVRCSLQLSYVPIPAFRWM